jgi:hypothetical protein
MLNWATENETNSNRYEIERSIDGVHFENRGNVRAVGNSNVTQRYQYFDDLNVNVKIVYYRLKMIDNDGSFEYSNIVPLKLNSVISVDDIKVYPSPFVSEFNVEINSQSIQQATIRLFSAEGKLIASKNAQLLIGKNVIKIDNLGILQRANYFVEITTENKTFTQKILKKAD